MYSDSGRIETSVRDNVRFRPKADIPAWRCEMKRQLTIRVAEAADTHAVWRIHTEAIRGIKGSHTADEIERWASKHSPDGYAEPIAAKRMFVAEVNGEPVGFGQFNAVTGVVERIYVLPSASGNGVGQALVREAERRALATGCSKLYLSSSLNAVAFYQRFGFVRDLTRAATREDGVPMIKTLPNGTASELKPNVC
jgi:putative acetyltransferase